jgi:lysophospholipid acyltransferase (LPLAT)-like uncharacterized protein
VPQVTTPEASTAVVGAPTPHRFTLRQRIILSLIVAIGTLAIRLICSTLRISISREDGANEKLQDRPLVISFWHACIIPATYAYRQLGIRVMSSNSYDGEYMGRIIRRYGFVAVKGSSSRNAVRALLGLRRALKDGWSVAFSIDGPRGPRYQVKPGPVTLGRSTGVPLCTFHIAAEKAWVLNTWDRLVIPKPFSRALLRMGKLIHVPHDATEEDLNRYQSDLQSTLDRIRKFAEANVHKVGSPEFPIHLSS